MTARELQYVKCQLCGKDEAEVLIPNEPSHIVRCRECGLVYRNPRVSAENEVQQYVEKQYSEEYIANWGRLRRFDEQLKNIERYSRKGKLLDIGCQFGEFMRVAEGAGWETRGVDPSVQTSEICKRLGLQIFHGTLQEANFPSESFDVTTMLLVLDQIPDPRAELAEIRRVLKRDGLLFVRVPNVTCHLLAHRLAKALSGALSSNLDPTVFHIYGFSAKTLRELLAQTGFRVRGIINSRPSKADPYRTDGPLRHLSMGIFKAGMHGLAQILYYASYRKLLMGTSIEAVAQNVGN